MRKYALIAALMLAASSPAMAQSTTPGQLPSPNAVMPAPSSATTTKGQEPSPNAIMPEPKGAGTTQGQELSPNAANPPQKSK